MKENKSNPEKKMVVCRKGGKRQKQVVVKVKACGTLICPSVPVAAATIPVPPLGNLANNFVAYALRIF